VRRELAEPVRRIPGDTEDEPRSGIALCLSGGGFRAMLFHLGALWRLHEVGFLDKLDRVSSVSGGSIAAARLALCWEELEGEGFREKVVSKLRELAGETLDFGSVLKGIVTPGTTSGETLAAAYRRHLFESETLQDLPDRPHFVFNATNVGSGQLVRFSKVHVADWKVGRIPTPRTEVAVAVACSSAFPPVLSPYRLDLRDAVWESEETNTLTGPEYRDELALSDGGVYDNLGLETVWKLCRTVIVSDAGGELVPQDDPAGDWVSHTFRVLKVVDNQVRELRKKQVRAGYDSGSRDGVYIGIRSNLENYEVERTLDCPQQKTLALARVPTRLGALPDVVQERLINWGYAICDAGLRAHVDATIPAAHAFPYPEAGVG
jgi:NTE family protein